jgi:predicted DCC family thiol-disulfide oxidoreductase YuxK
MQTASTLSHPVILFDGLCNLCSGSVQFVIQHDPHSHFRFASLQSDFGQQLLATHHLPATALNSFLLLRNDTIYQRSTAALLVAGQLSGAWKLLKFFLFVPRFLRDGVYNIISSNRYKWFGKKTNCWLPSPHLKRLFIS